ncbi:MAG: S41 family peptidase [Patescibacteria group bacterium]|nr:S41 family peptidase [Patescibacteria group bacterium]
MTLLSLRTALLKGICWLGGVLWDIVKVWGRWIWAFLCLLASLRHWKNLRFLLVWLLVFASGAVSGAYAWHQKGPGADYLLFERRITDNFYRDVPREQLVDGCRKGMVEALEDRHSSFKKREKAGPETTHKTVPVNPGFKIRTGNGRHFVTDLLPNGPAKRAGLSSNDEVVAIDGQPISEVVASRGERFCRFQDQTVSVTVRVSGNDTLDFEVSCSEASESVVSVNWLDSGVKQVALVSFNAFTDAVGNEFPGRMKNVVAQEPDGIVLDLRNNTGGLLEMATAKVASAWVGRRVVAFSVKKDGKPEGWFGDGEAVAAGVRTAVLVGPTTASAAEVLAGALKFYGLARVFGQKTFGKGVGQISWPYSGGYWLKLTNFRWFTPGNVSVTGNGVQPDVPVAVDPCRDCLRGDRTLDTAVKWLVESK